MSHYCPALNAAYSLCYRAKRVTNFVSDKYEAKWSYVWLGEFGEVKESQMATFPQIIWDHYCHQKDIALKAANKIIRANSNRLKKANIINEILFYLVKPLLCRWRIIHGVWTQQIQYMNGLSLLGISGNHKQLTIWQFIALFWCTV